MHTDFNVSFRRILRQEIGQDLAEYALLIALVAILIVGALIAFSDPLTGYWQRITQDLIAALS